MSQYTNTSEYQTIGNPPAGSIRFNTDSSKIELWNGEAWWDIDATSPELHTGGTRGLFGGGEPTTDTIDFINISSTGNATDFGNLTNSRQLPNGVSDRSRAVFCGGRTPSMQSHMDFVTMANAGTNASDFGDLTVAREDPAGVSNGTRAVLCGGAAVAPGNTIDYVTIAQTGNAVDFGDLYQKVIHQASGESKIRGVLANGYTPSTSNVIQYITISTLGNSADFGDSTSGGYGASGSSNAVTMVFNLGYNGSSHSTTMNSLTISTLGNSVFFGDLTRTMYAPGTCSSRIRGVFAGDYPSSSDVINYVQFPSLGDAIDFGDLVSGRGHWGGSSNGHGGL